MKVIAEFLGTLVIAIFVIGIPFICGEIASYDVDLEPIRSIFALLFMADFIFILLVVGNLCL